MRLQRILPALCLFLLPAPAAAAEWTPIGPDGGYVHSLTVAPSRPAVVYAGTRYGGVFRSLDRARSWSFAGLRGSWTWDLAVDPKNPDLVYAGTDRGLLKSNDGGGSWRSAGLELPGSTVVIVKIHPARPATVFAVADRRLYRTADRGRTWTSEPGWPEGVGALSFHPRQPNVVYAGAVEGLWKSTNSGRTWTRVNSEPTFIEALTVDPRAPRTLYAANFQSFWKSTNGGAAWTPIGPADFGSPRSSITIDPASSSIVYVSAAGVLFRSLDRGETWDRATAGLPGSVSVGRGVVATRYGLLAGSSTGVFLSTDRAAAWQAASRGITAGSVITLAAAAQEPPLLHAVTARGFFKSPDRGQTWLFLESDQVLTLGLPPLAIDPADPETLYLGGFQTVLKSTDGGVHWTRGTTLPCVVPVKIALDPQAPDLLYAAGTRATPICSPPGACFFARSQDAGATWQCLAEPPGIFLHVDPFDSAIYSGPQNLSRSADQGETWEPLFAGLNASFLDSVISSPLVPGTLWAGRNGEVGRSRDGGQTWEFFSAGLPPLDLIALAPDPVDPETLYAGTQRAGVFRSTDAGEIWSPAGVWPAGVTLLRGLVVDPADPSILYAGTDIASVLKLDQED